MDPSNDLAGAAAVRPSRFNLVVREPDGALLIFNSYSSALLQFTGGLATEVERLLGGGTDVVSASLAEYLSANGVLVPADCDELERARQLHERPFEEDNSLGLMLLSHENCNFRCVYCYEDFKKNRMEPWVIDGVVAMVRKRIKRLGLLQLGWFGGEPLLGMEVIDELSERLRALCHEQGTAMASSITTNGYLLNRERAARCLAAGISRYQITLDGPAHTHNRTRVLVSGLPTFDKVFENLQHLRDVALGFHVTLRVNFTPESIPHIPEFITFLGKEFGGDPRFSMRFRPVGRWGGANDDHLDVCGSEVGEEEELRFTELSLDAGFTMDTWRETMQPFGSTCYAASPRHFVIGSDGMVYKCTVAFNDPRNHVGQLDRDGELHLRPELLQQWTRSGEETDQGCQSCGFRPACQGNLCPLERLDGRDKRCPTTKVHFHRVLPLLAREARRAAASA